MNNKIPVPANLWHLLEDYRDDKRIKNHRPVIRSLPIFRDAQELTMGEWRKVVTVVPKDEYISQWVAILDARLCDKIARRAAREKTQRRYKRLRYEKWYGRAQSVE